MNTTAFNAKKKCLLGVEDDKQADRVKITVEGLVQKGGYQRPNKQIMRSLRAKKKKKTREALAERENLKGPFTKKTLMRRAS